METPKVTKFGSRHCGNHLKENEQICSKNDIWIRYKLQRAKLGTLSAQRNAESNMEYIKQDLGKVALEIQTVRMAISDLENANSGLDCKSTDVKEMSDVCKVKCSLNLDLTDLLQQECNLKRQLELTRIDKRNARLDNLLLTEELKRINERCFHEPSSNNWQDRLRRERRAKKNAILAREVTITSVANSITTHVLQKLHNPMKQTESVRSARENIDKYIKKSLQRARETTVIATTEFQLRQRRQVENLLKLKQDLEGIRRVLITKNEIKRTHDEEIAQEKDKVKGLLAAQGTNPYLAEYLLEVEEKQREIQRKMLMEEQKRLMDMQREYAVAEATKKREEQDRKKWDEHWAKQAKEKADKKKKEEQEMYYDAETDEEEEHQYKGPPGPPPGTVANENESSEEEKGSGSGTELKTIKSVVLPDLVPESPPKSDSKRVSMSESKKSKVGDAVSESRKSRVSESMKSKVGDVISESRKSRVSESMKSKVGDVISESMKSKVGDVISESRKSRVSASMKARVGDTASESKKSNMKDAKSESKKSRIEVQDNMSESKKSRGGDAKSETHSVTGSSENKSDKAGYPAENRALSVRKAIHLNVREKKSLLNIADESTKTVLMDGGRNIFDFGDVRVGERNYVIVNVANIGSENVSLRMSPLDPYGPFTFCNSLKEIPPDTYYSLKFKYMPTESGQSEETIKIEEAGKRENYIIIKLSGHGISSP